MGKISAKAVRTALNELPTGSEAYDHAYEEAMERIEGQNADHEALAKQVLSWITCAKRPLTTSELRHALAAEVGESLLDNDLPHIGDMVSVCAGLVTVDKGSDIIRLVHYMTQEYLERTQKQWFPNAGEITTICITYLSFDKFDSGFCLTDEDFEGRLQSNQLYDYAARNRGHHARNVSTSSHWIIRFLESEANIEAASQAMWVDECNHSQEAPRHVTGVHLAAHFGLEEVLQALLGRGHGLDLGDSNGRTPTMLAAGSGYEAIVALLQENGAHLGDKIDGRTALMVAAAGGHAAVITLRLANGVSPDARLNNGRTALVEAAGEG